MRLLLETIVLVAILCSDAVGAWPGPHLAPRAFANESLSPISGRPTLTRSRRPILSHSITRGRPDDTTTFKGKPTEPPECGQRDTDCSLATDTRTGGPILTTGSPQTTSDGGDDGSSTTTSCDQPSTITQFGTACLAYCLDAYYLKTVFQDVNFTQTLTSILTVPSGSTVPPLPLASATISTPIAPCSLLPVVGPPSNTPNKATPTTTVLLTSKLIVTSVSFEAPPVFTNPTQGHKDPVIPTPNVPPQSQVTLDQIPTPTVVPTTPATPPQNPSNQPGTPTTPIPHVNPLNRKPATITVGTVPVVIGPTEVVINSQTFANGPGETPIVTVGGQTFTISPSQVVGEGVTLVRPPPPAPVTPTSTVVGGVPILVGPSSVAVIGGSSFTIGPSSPQTSVVVNGQTISIGPGGIAVGTSTFAPSDIFPTPAPENILAVPTVEVIAGQTVTMGPVDNGTPNIPQFQTLTAGNMAITEVYVSSSTYAIFGGQTFVIGSMGASPLPAGITIPPNPSETAVLTAGGIAFTEVGSTLAIIDGTTYTIGPGATPTAAIISGQTVSFGPGGIGFPSTTFTVPSTTESAHLVTMAGLTFSEYGSTIAVIGGNTYRIGPGAWAVTEVVNGETLVIGPAGVAVVTTSSSTSSTSTSATASSTKKSFASRRWDRQHLRVVWTVCIGLGVWSWL